jgi:hypothetical protein
LGRRVTLRIEELKKLRIKVRNPQLTIEQTAATTEVVAAVVL